MLVSILTLIDGVLKVALFLLLGRENGSIETKGH